MGTRSPDKLPSLSRRARRLMIVGLGLIVLLVVGPQLVDTYVNWLWFGEVGFRRVWITVLLTRIATFVAVALVVGGTVFLAMLVAYRSRPVFIPDARPNDPIAPYRTQVMRRPRLFGWGSAVAVGVLCGLVAKTNWVTVQLFLHGGSFGIVDPEFGHDIGFFVFDLPFYRMVLNWLFVAVCLAFVASLATHYLFGGLRLTTGKGMLTQAARVQLAVLAGTLILLKAVAYWLDRYELLSGNRKEPTFTGAGYTDIHAALPAKLVMLAIAVLCAVAFFAAIFLHDMRIPAMATALLVLSAVLVGGVWPLLMEQFSVRPNAADVERPYIQRNIDATRQAFRLGSDWVEYRDYPGVGTKAPRRCSGGLDHHRQRPPAGPERALANLHPAAAAQEFLQLPRQVGPRPVSHRRRAAGLRRQRPRTVTRTASPAIRGTGSTGTPSTPTATVSSPPPRTG